MVGIRRGSKADLFGLLCKRVTSMSTIRKSRINIPLIMLSFLLAACGNSQSTQLKECLDLGQKYMTEMNYEEAIIAYNKALEIDPKNVDAYQALANIYEFRGDIDQAKSTMERALIAVPSNAELQSRYERLMQIPSSNTGTGTGKANPGSSLNGQSEGIPATQAEPAGSPTTAAPTEANIKADGWVQINGKWYFYAGGEKATGWMQQGETWFYFDEEGVLQHGKIKIGNDWYYFNEDGAMVTGWQEENGKWYYFGPDGRMLTDQWIEDTYYVGPDGAMLVSTTTPDGQEVDTEGKKIDHYEFAEIVKNYLWESPVDWFEQEGVSSAALSNGCYGSDLRFVIKTDTLVDSDQYIEVESSVYYIAYDDTWENDPEERYIGEHKIRIKKGAVALGLSHDWRSGLGLECEWVESGKKYEVKINSASDLKQVFILQSDKQDVNNTIEYSGWGGETLYVDKAGYVVVIQDQISG